MKLVRESLNEISADLFKSALGKTKEYDQYNRGFYMGKTFLREFLGKNLFDGTIEDIGASNADSFFAIYINVVSKDSDGRNRSDKAYYYNIDKDQYTNIPEEVSRTDARILSKIATKVNPESKYVNINKEFNVKYPLK